MPSESDQNPESLTKSFALDTAWLPSKRLSLSLCAVLSANPIVHNKVQHASGFPVSEIF
jgi:hypothetical protein